ncbi:hypothetical protein AMS68_000028 [Peltaster fructicola]|uniref:Uncharacterized protein n=1 Tax=Peltaster fructicola TaxID=286661 RepID=A0A6H0XIQ2_9PEZI|nr:hypothetical protein AMS68_000028 [Peltaster fructicola]
MAPTDYQHEYFNVTFPSEYVAHVEINRPKKLNAFVSAMWEGLGAIFRKMSYDPDIRVIVISGAGDRAFSAGLDVQAAATEGPLAGSENQNLDQARKAAALRRHIFEFQDDITAVEKCTKPVIAVLHGVAYGLAIDLSSACDIRFCAKNTRFSVKEVDIGIAADIGTLTRLPKANVPMSFIKEVALTAREFTPAEALQFGFVSGVFETKDDALAKALQTAALIASKSPVAVQSTKDVINFSRDHSVSDGLNYVAQVNSAMFFTKDVEDSMTAGLQKRKPKFAKL